MGGSMSRFKGWLYCIQHGTSSYSKPGRRMSNAKNVISGGRATEEHHTTLCASNFGHTVRLLQMRIVSYSGNCFCRCCLLGAGERLRRTGKMFPMVPPVVRWIAQRLPDPLWGLPHPQNPRNRGPHCL